MKKLLYPIIPGVLFMTNLWAAEPGNQAPTCNTTDFTTHEPIDINQYQGKVVYLDFWASWCPPCKKSFPALNKLHQELNKDGFEILAINLDEKKQDASDFLQANPVDFTIASNEQKECPEVYQVMAMPSSYLIDKKGVIRKVHLGFKDRDVSGLRATILTLLAE